MEREVVPAEVASRRSIVCGAQNFRVLEEGAIDTSASLDLECHSSQLYRYAARAGE